MFHSYGIRYFYLINLVVERVNERRCLICFFVFFFFHIICFENGKNKWGAFLAEQEH